jgi:mono/diheme cytochrome c family protein
MDNPHDHAPAKPEFSHPLVWTIALAASCLALALWFIAWFGSGAETARTKPMIALPTAGPAEPDHAALIADRTEAVVERGGRIYGQNCASCHGVDGAGVGTARSFTQGAFRNELGGGPYAFYQVLVKGYGSGMPAFMGLPAEDKYAVVHYVRERFMRGRNPAFVEADPATVTIPPPGAADGADATHAAKPVPLAPMMAGIARVEGDAVARRLQAIVAAVRGSDLEPAIAAGFASLVTERPACAALLCNAAAQDDRAACDALIQDPDGRGTTVPGLACLTAPQRAALFSTLRRAAAPKGT